MAIPLDLGMLSAAINATAGIVVLWIMQRVTYDAGFSNYLGVVKSIHRMFLGALAILLVANAGQIIIEHSTPRVDDVATQFVFLCVIILSAIRHAMIATPNHSVGIT